MIATETQDPLAALKSSKPALLAALADAGAVITDDIGHLRCPWHDDRNGSLSVYPHEGTWRWRCHTCEIGGTIVDVVLKIRELERDEDPDAGDAIREAIERYGEQAQSAHADAPSSPPSSSKFRPALPTQPPAQPPRETFPSLADVAAALGYRARAICTSRHHYTDVANNITMAVLRFERADGSGKTFRPVYWTGSAWAIGDPPGLLPLYRLAWLAVNPSLPVVVVEGERCADALAAQGFLSTTSAHGAKSAMKTDWSPLAGRDVTIWPDNDDAGLVYRDNVARILANLTPPARVKFIDPKALGIPLPPGGDVVDFIKEIPK